ncbi:MAG: hypothetical protein AB4368_02050 [Xenococcaceae cyanobacterium]
MSFVRSYLRKNSVWVHLWLFLFWLAVGIGLRFTNLESKPPWADEWATLVFSLGHGFRDVPLDQIISLDTLLLPVQLDSTTQVGDVVRRLMQESTHPPLYFILTHQYLKLFSPQSGLVSLVHARALSALFGVLGIPAIFGCSWLLSRSLVVSQIAAGLMAFSPYGIYLAQETRHYTLAILWVMASLSCLLVTVRHLQKNAPPPNWLMLVWVLVNSIGVATHYFFGLTLVAETIVLLGFWLPSILNRLKHKSLFDALFPLPFRRIGMAMLGTFIGCGGWIFAWRDIPDNQLTDWIQHGNPLGSEFFEPIGRLIAWITTMVLLLPIENTSSIVVIISSVFLTIGLLWLIFTIVKYLAKSTTRLDSLLLKQVIVRFILAATLLVLGFAYGFDRDLTLAARFQFFYFPAVLLLIAVVLADSWQYPATGWGKKSIVIFTLSIAILGGLTVINNYGYTKPDRPDIVVPVMIEAQQLTPQIPVLVATVHKNHEQTGEMMGIAWEWANIRANGRLPLQGYPHFLLLHKKEDATVATRNLYRNLALLPRPLDIWLVNFAAPDELEQNGCSADEYFKRKSPGYRYRLYHCL